jgi:hypothetical protein
MRLHALRIRIDRKKMTGKRAIQVEYSGFMSWKISSTAKWSQKLVGLLQWIAQVGHHKKAKNKVSLLSIKLNNSQRTKHNNNDERITATTTLLALSSRQQTIQ